MMDTVQDHTAPDPHSQNDKKEQSELQDEFQPVNPYIPRQEQCETVVQAETPRQPLSIIASAEEKMETFSRELGNEVTKLYNQVVRNNSPPPPLPISNVKNAHAQDDSTRPNSAAALLEEGQNPLNLLPEEVWRMVLEDLTELSDLYNCWMTCTLFRNLLLHREREIITYVNLPSQWFLKYQGRSVMERSLDEHPLAVHQFLRDHPSMRPFVNNNHQDRVEQFEFINPLNQYGRVPTFDFRKNYRHIEQPVLMPERYDGSPFIGNQLFLNLRMTDDAGVAEDVLMWETVGDFLRNHGMHAKYMTLKLEEHLNEGREDDTAEPLPHHTVNFLLHQLPTYLPNLRRLALYVCFDMYETPSGIFPAAAPLPSLETLLIRTSCDFCQHSPIVQSLIASYHSQLGILHVAGNVWTRMARNVTWPNLKELSVDTVDDAFNFASLLPCIQMPRLEKISIDGLVEEAARVETCLKMLRDIVDASTTIKTLAIGGIWMDLLRWSLDSDLTFPVKLQTLILDLGYHKMKSYMFLISRFASVKNVHIYVGQQSYLMGCDTGITIWEDWDQETDEYVKRIRRRLHNEPDPVLKLNRLMPSGAMYKSNLWRWMPQLQVFSYQFKVYTRQEYLQRRGL